MTGNPDRVHKITRAPEKLEQYYTSLHEQPSPRARKTIERQRNLYFHTKEILEQLPYRIKAFLGDGFEGLPTYAPFDRILITAGAPLIPPKLIEQLKPNGIMVIPIDEGEPGHQKMRRITKNPDGTLREEVFGDFTFVPMLTGTGND